MSRAAQQKHAVNESVVADSNGEWSVQVSLHPHCESLSAVLPAEPTTPGNSKQVRSSLFSSLLGVKPAGACTCHALWGGVHTGSLKVKHTTRHLPLPHSPATCCCLCPGAICSSSGPGMPEATSQPTRAHPPTTAMQLAQRAHTVRPPCGRAGAAGREAARHGHHAPQVARPQADPPGLRAGGSRGRRGAGGAASRCAPPCPRCGCRSRAWGNCKWLRSPHTAGTLTGCAGNKV